ncbi:hypothetical protein D9M68_262570 [compost metagenome]
MQQLGDLLVLHRLQVAEGQVLQLPLDVADAEAVGERRVDVEDFAGDAVALLLVGVLHRADGAGALGQLDQCDAHVVDHRHQHLAQVLHLRLGAEHHGLPRVETGADRRHAQHALDQLGDHRTEALLHGFQLDLAFAHAAVDHRGHQGFLVELEVRQDFGDFQTGLEAGGPLRPGVFRTAAGLLLGLAGEFARLQQDLAVQHRDQALDMVQPGLEVDAAVGVDRLVRSHLYHLSTLPHGAGKCTAQNAGFFRICS